MNILLVDDDEVIRMGMRKLIEKADRGWSVKGEFSDGAMALDYLEGNSDTDLVICDVRMPIMDGLEFVQAVRQRGFEHLKIIMLSGHNDFEYVRSAFMNGAFDYILKPFKKDEFIALIEKVQGEIGKEKRARQTEKETNDFFVSELLRKLSTCDVRDIEGYLSQLAEHGVNTSRSFFAGLSVIADQYYRQFSQAGQYRKMLEGVMEKAEKFCKRHRDISFIIALADQAILMMVMSDDRDELLGFAEKLFDELNLDSEITVTVGISSIYGDIQKIPQSFEEARMAASSRFYLGQKQFIQYRQIEGKCIDIDYDPGQAVDGLEHAVALSDYAGAKKIIEQIFLDLSYCEADRFRRYIRSCLDMLSLRTDSFGSYIKANSQEIDFYIEYLNTYRELKTYISTLFKNAIEYIDSEKDKKSLRRIEMARDYIMQHYRESITLGDIADYVELNASYFSNLFKTQTGMNFTEFLLDVRMNKAKELLKDPKIRIYEIGNLVGYEDAVSFGRAFKKKWGISPKEYRNLVY